MAQGNPNPSPSTRFGQPNSNRAGHPVLYECAKDICIHLANTDFPEELILQMFHGFYPNEKKITWNKALWMKTWILATVNGNPAARQDILERMLGKVTQVVLDKEPQEQQVFTDEQCAEIIEKLGIEIKPEPLPVDNVEEKTE